MIDRNTLLSLVVCPSCQSSMKSFVSCENCGVNYLESDGTPVLIPASISRKVTFDFQQNRSVAGEEFKLCFSYPVKCGAAGSPYHLDFAHLDIFDHLDPQSTILEIGCGGAQMRGFLETKQFQYIGVDISKNRVNDSLKQFGGPDLLCDSHFLPFKNNSFDIVYSAAVTEHLASPYLVAQEVARVLKPRGYYLGNVSFLEPWHDNSFFHMSPLGVFELLTQANFEVINIWPSKGYSGFQSIFLMGNKATKLFLIFGQLTHVLYRVSNYIKNLLIRKNKDCIESDARIAGATDWIARKK